MALFSEDLFNVFEETEKPSTTKSKKRKREDKKASEDGASTSEELKKVKVEPMEDDDGATTNTKDESMAQANAYASLEGVEENQSAVADQAFDNVV